MNIFHRQNLKSIMKEHLTAESGEVEVLLAAAIKKDRAFILAHPEYIPTIPDRIVIRRFLKKFRRGWPIAYITGHKEFFGLDFLVNKNVLIPRPETEMMVEAAISEISNFSPYGGSPEGRKNLNNQILIVDVGTGSGCVPISIIKTLKHKNIKTLAIDISNAALKTARKNAKRHGVDIEFLHGDLLEPIIKSKIQNTNYKLLITANLPYLTAEQFASEPSIQHEPRTALIADDQTGLSLYEKLFKQTASLCELRTVGCELILEIDPRQSTAALTLAKKNFPGAKVEIKKDLAGHDRLVLIKIENSNLKQ